MSDLASTVFSIIMVGHSLFGADGPDMLDAALSATSDNVQVQAQIINGAPLKYNWEHSDEAEGIDARRVLPRGGTTDLIVTEAIPLANHLQWSETDVYAQAFAGLALSGNADARVFVQETWHSLKSGTGVQIEYDDGAAIPWRERLAQDLPAWEGMVTLLRAGQPDADDRVRLIPAGQALARLDDAIAAGDVPGLSRISEIFEDDIHLNLHGHYFVSMVQYAVLTGASPEGLPHRIKDRYGADINDIDAEMARAMQRVAREAVEGYTVSALISAGPIKQAQASTAPRAPPVVAVPVTKAVAPVIPEGAIAVGLSPVTDWAAQIPFLDLMKTARPWLGHLPGQFGGIEYEMLVAQGFIDGDGWPTAVPREAGSVGTMILTDLPEAAASTLEGRYVLRFEGTGIVEAAGRATNLRYGRGEVRFDYTPGPGSVEIRIQRSSASDPVRNIAVVRKDRLSQWEQGVLFNPDWTDRMAHFDTLRFMDWMETNDSTQSLWENRPKASNASWAQKGVPLEIMLALANRHGKNVWFNMPHLADDAYVRAFAKTVHESIDPALTVYVEYSNEVWNFQFEQTRWADAQAQLRWGQVDVSTQFYALRAAEIARIWSDEFADDAERLVNVISSQTGWLGLEENILNAPLVMAEGAQAPAHAFDAYAVTGYFGGVLGLEARNDDVIAWLDESLARATDAARDLTGPERQAAIEATKYDYATQLAAQDLLDGSVSGNMSDTVHDLRARVFPYHAQVARDAGLEMIMYEGGTHIVGIGPQVDNARLQSFFEHLNYTPEMGALYTELLAAWEASGGRLFNAYADVYVPTKWGSWGLLRHLGDDNPRWDALVADR
ncbi:MAG: hypothetical protein WBG95_12905 [Sulfitobacter sp.]